MKKNWVATLDKTIAVARQPDVGLDDRADALRALRTFSLDFSRLPLDDAERAAVQPRVESAKALMPNLDAIEAKFRQEREDSKEHQKRAHEEHVQEWQTHWREVIANSSAEKRESILYQAVCLSSEDAYIFGDCGDDTFRTIPDEW